MTSQLLFPTLTDSERCDQCHDYTISIFICPSTDKEKQHNKRQHQRMRSHKYRQCRTIAPHIKQQRLEQTRQYYHNHRSKKQKVSNPHPSIPLFDLTNPESRTTAAKLEYGKKAWNYMLTHPRQAYHAFRAFRITSSCIEDCLGRITTATDSKVLNERIEEARILTCGARMYQYDKGDWPADGPHVQLERLARTGIRVIANPDHWTDQLNQTHDGTDFEHLLKFSEERCSKCEENEDCNFKLMDLSLLYKHSGQSQNSHLDSNNFSAWSCIGTIQNNAPATQVSFLPASVKDEFSKSDNHLHFERISGVSVSDYFDESYFTQGTSNRNELLFFKNSVPHRGPAYLNSTVPRIAIFASNQHESGQMFKWISLNDVINDYKQTIPIQTPKQRTIVNDNLLQSPSYVHTCEAFLHSVIEAVSSGSLNSRVTTDKEAASHYFNNVASTLNFVLNSNLMEGWQFKTTVKRKIKKTK